MENLSERISKRLDLELGRQKEAGKKFISNEQVDSLIDKIMQEELANKKKIKNIHINNDDNYATPPDFYNKLNEEFGFDFDPCPYNEDIITSETDGLLKEWGKVNFVNPPYSQKLKEQFILKAIEEQKKGKISVFLIPVSTSTKLFHEHIKPNSKEIRFIKGRIKFGKRDKDGNFYLPLNKHGKTQSGTKDSMIVIF